MSERNHWKALLYKISPEKGTAIKKAWEWGSLGAALSSPEPPVPLASEAWARAGPRVQASPAKGKEGSGDENVRAGENCRHYLHVHMLQWRNGRPVLKNIAKLNKYIAICKLHLTFLCILNLSWNRKMKTALDFANIKFRKYLWAIFGEYHISWFFPNSEYREIKWE